MNMQDTILVWLPLTFKILILNQFLFTDIYREKIINIDYLL